MVAARARFPFHLIGQSVVGRVCIVQVACIRLAALRIVHRLVQQLSNTVVERATAIGVLTKQTANILRVFIFRANVFFLIALDQTGFECFVVPGCDFF